MKVHKCGQCKHFVTPHERPWDRCRNWYVVQTVYGTPQVMLWLKNYYKKNQCKEYSFDAYKDFGKKMKPYKPSKRGKPQIIQLKEPESMKQIKAYDVSRGIDIGD